MSFQNALSAYHQISARGATPVGQVVTLYDTILRDLHRARAAFEAGDIETRVFELNHALTVIGHLQSTLDRERGGEASKQLDHFYRIVRPMILELNTAPSREGLQRLIDLFAPLRQAWDEASQKIPAGAPPEAKPEIRVSMISPANAPPSGAEQESESTPNLWRG
jgi:flagellar secretion chaperone FliS